MKIMAQVAEADVKTKQPTAKSKGTMKIFILTDQSNSLGTTGDPNPFFARKTD